RNPPKRRHHTPAIYRRRRVLAALLLLNAVELIGVVLVGPGFWISVSVSGALLVAYVVHLRKRALAERRRRRAEAREAAWLAERGEGGFAGMGGHLLALAPARSVQAGRDRCRSSGGGVVAQSGSAPRSHRGGQGFESPQLHPVQGPFPSREPAFFRAAPTMPA